MTETQTPTVHTDQSLFDRVARHLLTQGQPAKPPVGACRYRQPVGDLMLKCAIGGIIPDASYRPWFEGYGLASPQFVEEDSSEPIGKLIAQAASIPVELLPLGQELQRLHDLNNPASWREELLGIALRRGLATGVLDAF